MGAIVRTFHIGTAEATAAFAKLEGRALDESVEVLTAVQTIVQDVRRRGDLAVHEYQHKFASASAARVASPPSATFEVDGAARRALAARVAPDVRGALERAASRIRGFHDRWREPQVSVEETVAGVAGAIRISLRAEAIDRVGLYVPGGGALYPSTVLMTAIPARSAGVREVVMTTPSPSPEVALAAELAGVDRIFAIGGAQAIAALAYGTETVPKVDKIVGPGGIYVTCAKRLVYGVVDLDQLAGPSEVVLVADERADPELLAADLLAQAEHDVEAVAVLVTSSAAVAQGVVAAVERQTAVLSRSKIAIEALRRHGAIFVAAELDQALVLADRLASEHLGLHVSDPRAAATKIRRAGAIFLGDYTPEALGDYLAGPSHVLPTGGTARFRSPLGVYDFLRRSSLVEYSREALAAQLADVTALARVEGLEAHARAAELRFRARDPLVAAYRGGSQPVRLGRAAEVPIMVREQWRQRLRPALSQLKSYQVPAVSPTAASTGAPAAVEPIRLNANESPLPLPADVAEALGRELARVELNRYPDIRAGELRRLLADDLKVAPDQLVLGNGGDELLALLPQVFAHPRPGQERARLLWPGPSFVQYRTAAIGAGLEPVEVPLRRDFTLDVDTLFQSVERERPNLIYFCRPNNPTGALWPRAVVEQLLQRYPDTLVMVDEAYRDYAAGETVVDLVADAPQLIVLSTLSKWGLAGLRLGYVVASPEVAAEVDKLRGPYNLGALVQRTATFLLGQHRPLLRSIIATVVAERERVIQALQARGDVEVFPSATNFVLVRYADHEAAQAVWQPLAAANILVRTFSAPGAPLEGCLRITIGTREENDAVLRALGDA